MRHHANCRAAFSLLELSIVVAILAVVATLGLELATSFMGRRAYTSAQLQVARIDQALIKFYHVNGRLPCPAVRGLPTTNSNFGVENCGVTTYVAGVLPGLLPFRTLSIQQREVIDPYGNQLSYAVSEGLTDGATFAAGSGTLEIRTGKIEATCSTICTVLSAQAAYIVFSSGADMRGAVSRFGTEPKSCAPEAAGNFIDRQNCASLLGDNTHGIAFNVFYDSRFNNGTNAATLKNYFDDIVAWRNKGDLF